MKKLKFYRKQLPILIVFALFTGILACGNNNGVQPELEPEPDHTKGDLVITLPGGAKMAFIWIEPGSFYMGEPEKSGTVTASPLHQVTITKGFYLGKYEITQRQWSSLMDTKPWALSVVKGIGDDYPVVFVTWIDVQNFIIKLNEYLHTTAFRLPTEAEWEYACKAGTQTTWSFGNEPDLLKDYAWYKLNSDSQAHIVGFKLPNPWGLYDMHGNVEERNQDGPRQYTVESQIDPVGPEPPISQFGPSYGRRGGSWQSPDTGTRSVQRYSSNMTGIAIGFRILREGPK